MSIVSLPKLSLLSAASAAALLAGCATVAGPSAATSGSAAAPAAPTAVAAAATPPAAPAAKPAAAASTPANGASAPAARPPGAPTPFADVIKDATRSPGFLVVWAKDEKTWLEVPADLLDKPFFMGSSLASGLGEGFVLPGLMGRRQVAVLHRAGNTLQLIARNLTVRAPDGTPLARALGESYSDSLLASAPLASAPHPERKSLLVDANALLGGDLNSLQTQLESSFRLSYALDRGNTSIERIRTSDQSTSVTFRAHFAVPRLPAPPSFVPGGPTPNPAMLPNPPRSLPDARSLFLSIAYTLAPLPAQPMRPRVADQRVGFFTTGYTDLANDTSEGRRKHLIHRWRLEKKDPAAAVSDPKEPIRVVMDRNIPEKWRDAVRAGILEWNKGFERAGFSHAIALEQQADNADWASTEGTRLLAVRWFAAEGPGALAVGPSQADPRTGELLRGAAIIPENWVRIFRSRAQDTVPRLGMGGQPGSADELMMCTQAADAIEQAAFGFSLLAERGDFDPIGPEAEAYIRSALKDVVMHEVGHALGLRHNFKASMGITAAQLRDPAFTRSRGVSNSVMDYNALNIALPGEPVSDIFMPTLGTYDYWAIEYGYREFAPETEARELAAIAARSEREVALQYATDEDAYGSDPTVNMRDLGDDPIAFARREFKLTHELWSRTQARQLKPDDDYTVYRRNLQRGLYSVQALVPMLARHVGGAVTSRQLAGANEALVTPVSPARQREALEVLLGEVFNSGSFRFDPKFMSRLGIEQFDRIEASRLTSVDFSLPGAVLDIQRSALDTLMSDSLAVRLADAETKVADPRSLVSYAEVQTRLGASVWSELKAGQDIDSLRRSLQREHLKRLASALLRPSSGAAADVRAVHRLVAQRLEAELRRSIGGKGLSDISRAHLTEAAQTLAEALKAPLIKQGV